MNPNPPRERYVAKFSRVGRQHDVPDLPVHGTHDEILDQLYRYIRPRLGSRDIDVDVVERDGELYGYISAGMNNGGSFSLARISGVSR